MKHAYESRSSVVEDAIWLRSLYAALRRRLEASSALAEWRRPLPRPLEIEALLMAYDPLRPGQSGPTLGRALGLSPDQTRTLLRRAGLAGVLEGSAGLHVLTPRGRQLLGALEGAQARALQGLEPLAGGPQLWAQLQRTEAA